MACNAALLLALVVAVVFLLPGGGAPVEGFSRGEYSMAELRRAYEAYGKKLRYSKPDAYWKHLQDAVRMSLQDPESHVDRVISIYRDAVMGKYLQGTYPSARTRLKAWLWFRTAFLSSPGDKELEWFFGIRTPQDRLRNRGMGAYLRMQWDDVQYKLYLAGRFSGESESSPEPWEMQRDLREMVERYESTPAAERADGCSVVEETISGYVLPARLLVYTWLETRNKPAIPMMPKYVPEWAAACHVDGTVPKDSGR